MVLPSRVYQLTGIPVVIVQHDLVGPKLDVVGMDDFEELDGQLVYSRQARGQSAGSLEMRMTDILESFDLDHRLGKEDYTAEHLQLTLLGLVQQQQAILFRVGVWQDRRNPREGEGGADPVESGQSKGTIQRSSVDAVVS